MNLTKQQKILIAGGTAVFILVIAVIIFIIIHNHKSKSNDECTWSVGEWIACTNGEQTRDVTCKNDEGGDCNDSNCTGTKPPTTQDCKLYCCNQTTWDCTDSPDNKTCPQGTSQTYDCTSCTSNIFPPNVYIFRPEDDTTTTQKIIDDIFLTQGGTDPVNNGQNSKYNYAFLFMPGTYNLNIHIGFYTHVAGLGKTNNEVIINGGPRVDNGSTDHTIGALNNFWRTCENMTVKPLIRLPGDNQVSMIYAVSQSCSLRSVNVNGILHLGAMEAGGMGFASGGFMANCNIEYDLNMGSQQQFICRNTQYGSFPVALWNQVNVGCTSDNENKGCCINTTEPQISSSTLTVVESTPRVMEKPYLAYDYEDGFVVLCPGLSVNTKGNTSETFTTITKDNYRIVTDDIEVTELNGYLSASNIKCIIFSPGRYNIDSPIKLNGQLLFGLGIPVLTSTKNNNIITGYGNICGLIFDAGFSNTGKREDNILVNLDNINASFLWDIICRVGGGDDNDNIYEVNTMLYIGGNNSILDNVWCWVADHYANNNEYVGWEKAVCKIGVHVKGENVIAYGLFAEHTQYRNVLWEGDKGEVYMFQSEFNYFPPPKFNADDFVAYEVTQNVNKHTLKGGGAYSFFPSMPPNNPIPTTMALAGFKFADVTKIDYENLTTVFLNGYGGIRYVFYDQKGNTGGQVVKRIDPKTKSETQISVVCNKDGKNICSCKSVCPINTTCENSQGRCKPTNNACTVNQMKYRNDNKKSCNPGQWICTSPPQTLGCSDTDSNCADGSNMCEWW
jgi:hypothetical protein